MNTRKIIFTTIISLLSLACHSQGILSLEFLKDTTPKGRQYIKLIFKADSLFKARNFQNAVEIYDRAHALKSYEKYPKFKAEDIRTLYMQNKIAKDEVKQAEPREYWYSKMHKQKVEREERKKLLAEGKTIETEKKKEILAENKKQQNNLTEVKKEEVKTFKADEKTKKDEEARLKAYEELKAKEEMEERQKAENEKKAKKEMETRVIAKDEKKKEKEKEIITISDIIIQKSKEEQEKRIYAQASVSLETKPEDEEKMIAAKYPNEKTIETIKEKTKTITQVIFNKNGRITIYLRVEHNWGQTFYFVKETGQPMMNVSRDYFDRYTR